MKSIKKVSMITCFIIVSVLNGCSRDPNPLTTAYRDDASKFLFKASLVAERELKLNDLGEGAYYGACMRGKIDEAICNNLYQLMVVYAKSTQDFKNVRLADLTDQSMFRLLRPRYERDQFNDVE